MGLRFSPARGASVVISSSSRGPTGAAATIAVGTVTTGAAGTSVTVSNSGSSSAAVFNFAIPRGDTGDFTTGLSTSVDGESVLFSGTGGKTGKRATLTANLVKSTSGIRAAAAAADIDAVYALGNWKADYLNGSSVRTAIALGADKTLYASNGAAAAPTFRTLANLGILEFGATAALTAGYTSASVSAGTKSTGTYTFDPTAGAVQHVTNGGAHTFAPPATMGAWMLDYVNNASAGALTTSGWTKVDGDLFDTTNTHAFRCMLSVGNSGSYLSVKRMV